MTNEFQIPLDAGPPERTVLDPTVELRRKTLLIGRYLDSLAPPEGDDALLIGAPMMIVNNQMEMDRRDSPIKTKVREHLLAPEPFDPFGSYDLAEELVAETLRIRGGEAEGATIESIDMSDLFLAATTVIHIYWNSSVGLEDQTKDISATRRRVTLLVETALLLLVQRVPLSMLQVSGQYDLLKMDRRLKIVPEDHALHSTSEAFIQRAQLMVDDRQNAARVIAASGFTAPRVPGEENAYNMLFRPGEREALNDAAAATIELLHRNKVYGVTPLVASGRDLGLPFDVAMMPPATNREGVYAEGAIADFMFLSPADTNEQARVRYQREGKQLFIEFGNRNMLMRFRLHDNGQMTHGGYMHNSPGDFTEALFKTVGASEAFDRLRAVLIAFATDGCLSEQVVPSRRLKATVPQGLSKLKVGQPIERAATHLLLQRQIVLDQLEAQKTQPQPPAEGEVVPRRPLERREGYFMKLRPGYQPRATAWAEAEEDHARRGVPFPGMREGYTWVPPYMADPNEVPLREARFRRSSQVAKVQNALGNAGLAGEVEN
ncbi:MAG TPA: hypothetical protein VLI54_04095 [Bacillota bacterium]|nr:hypothetical protein [Bacillota bacterium]